MLKNSYWNNTGKYQSLKPKVPSRGYSTNPYLNLYLLVSKLYYDVYNNGGCNISDSYIDDIQKFGVPFKKEAKFYKTHFTKCNSSNDEDLQRLENTMDNVFNFLMDKDMSYVPCYLIWDKRDGCSKVLVLKHLKNTEYKYYLPAVLENGYAESETIAYDGWKDIRIWEYADFDKITTDMKNRYGHWNKTEREDYLLLTIK